MWGGVACYGSAKSDFKLEPKCWVSDVKIGVGSKETQCLIQKNWI